MTDYALNTAVALYTVVRGEEGVQVTPSDIVLRVYGPDGTLYLPEVNEVTQDQLAAAALELGQELSGVTGVYIGQITPDVSGTWNFHWQASVPTVAIYSWFQVPWPTVPVEVS